MKNILITMFCLGLATPLMADDTKQFANDNDRVSYAYGMLNGSQWKSQDLSFDPDIFMQGLKDGLAGKPAMTETEARAVMQKFSTEFRNRQFAKFKVEGETFLNTNKLAPGVKIMPVMLPNGQASELQYLVVTNGTGPTPSATDHVSVIYRGTLVNGTEFDSSRGHPTSFPVGGVIKGWSEALQKMPVGSEWKLFIPSELGYGERGAQPRIPPNSALIFDVQLVGIEVAPPPPAPAAPLTSDIIKVPSADELKKGAKIEVIKPDDVQKAQAGQTNK